MANLPFWTDRLFGVLVLKNKPTYVRLFELVMGYCLVGYSATLIERRAHGAAYSQGWEFYVLTLCLFLVFAFPGFVFRFLWRQH